MAVFYKIGADLYGCLNGGLTALDGAARGQARQSMYLDPLFQQGKSPSPRLEKHREDGVPDLTRKAQRQEGRHKALQSWAKQRRKEKAHSHLRKKNKSRFRRYGTSADTHFLQVTTGMVSYGPSSASARAQPIQETIRVRSFHIIFRSYFWILADSPTPPEAQGYGGTTRPAFFPARLRGRYENPSRYRPQTSARTYL